MVGEEAGVGPTGVWHEEGALEGREASMPGVGSMTGAGTQEYGRLKPNAVGLFEASLIGIFSSFAQTTFQDQLLYLRASSPERYLGRIVYEDTTERSDTGHAVGPARA